MEMIKKFFQEEDGMETIEVVVIIAVLLTIALVFRKSVIKFVQDLIERLFKVNSIPEPTDTPTVGE